MHTVIHKFDYFEEINVVNIIINKNDPFGQKIGEFRRKAKDLHHWL